MADLDQTLAAIDAVTAPHCGACGRRLRADGPSPDFCDETCQTVWAGARSRARTDYPAFLEPIGILEGNVFFAPASTPPPTGRTIASLWADGGFVQDVTFENISLNHDLLHQIYADEARAAGMSDELVDEALSAPTSAEVLEPMEQAIAANMRSGWLARALAWAFGGRA